MVDGKTQPVRKCWSLVCAGLIMDNIVRNKIGFTNKKIVNVEGGRSANRRHSLRSSSGSSLASVKGPTGGRVALEGEE